MDKHGRGVGNLTALFSLVHQSFCCLATFIMPDNESNQMFIMLPVLSSEGETVERRGGRV